MVHYRVSYKDLKSRLPKLKEEDYNSKYADIKSKYSAPADPNITFNDGTKTIEISYFGEDFFVYNRPLMTAIKNAFPYGEGSASQQIDATFSTPEAGKRKVEILENSRATIREVEYKEVPSNTPPPDPLKSDLENLKDIAASNPSGVSFGGGHGDSDRNALMDKLLADPGHGGLSLFFIEELGVIDQPLVEQYLASAKDDPMPPALTARITNIAGLKEMLAKMRDHNAANPGDKLKVYGINSSEAKSRSGILGLENRVAMMNATAKEVMDKAMRDNPGQKFMSFVGAAHSNTHPGGVPGISQIYGVPAIKLKDGKLIMDEEDKSLRGMPTAEEIKKIEKLGETFLKSPQATGLDQDQKHEQLQKFIAQTRVETFATLDRQGKKEAVRKRLAMGAPLDEAELAEAIVIQAEDTVLAAYPQKDDEAEAQVKAKKHAELVKDLTARLRQLPPDKKSDPGALITKLADGVAGGSALGFYKKDSAIKKGAAHVSINTASAKRTWIAQLAKL